MSSSDAGSDKGNQVIKPNAFPIDLAQKIALVKPTDSKGATVQTHQFRFVIMYCIINLELNYTVARIVRKRFGVYSIYKRNQFDCLTMYFCFNFSFYLEHYHNNQCALLCQQVQHLDLLK